MRVLLPVGAVLLLIAALWSRTVTVVPEWTVTVEQSDGTPIPRVPVLQAWHHQTVEAESHTQRLATDESGRVVFARREITISGLRLAVGAVSAVLRTAHETSFGPFGQVVIGIEGRTTGCELLGYMPRIKKQEGPLTSKCVVTGPYTIKQL
jgi:hypothetical protein